MAPVDAQVKALLVARLRDQRAAGDLSSAEVRAAAREIGVGERTSWRWLSTTEPPPPRHPRRDRYEITEADRDAYAAWRGNVAAVHRALYGAGAGGPSLRRLQAAFARDLTPGERAAAVDGVEGRRRHEVYLRWAPNRRNALWEGDHVELPVLVIAPRAQRARKPWATLFIDGFSRLIMGWALSLYPTSGVVLAALRQGMAVDPARGPFGGLRGATPGQRVGVRRDRAGAVVRGAGCGSVADSAVHAAPQGQDREGESDPGPGVPVRAAVLHPRRAGRGRAAVRAGR